MSDLPFATVRVVDGMRPGDKRVEVIVSGEAVAQIPAVAVEYELAVRGISIMRIGVHVRDAALEGGAGHLPPPPPPPPLRSERD
jgi:hypothetical protein